MKDSNTRFLKENGAGEVESQKRKIDSKKMFANGCAKSRSTRWR